MREMIKIGTSMPSVQCRLKHIQIRRANNKKRKEIESELNTSTI